MNQESVLIDERNMAKSKKWESEKPPYQLGVNGFTQKNLKDHIDEDGWVKEDFCRPINYDLVHLWTDDGRSKSGWWTGQRWDGLRVKDEDIVKLWKKYEEEDAFDEG